MQPEIAYKKKKYNEIRRE